MEMTFLRNATCCLPFDVSTQSVTNIYAHFIIIMCFVIIYNYVLILLICWALRLPEVVPIYFKKCHDLWPCLLCDCENYMKLLPWCVVVWLKMTSRGSLGMALLFGGVTLLDQVWSCWRKCLTEGGEGQALRLGKLKSDPVSLSLATACWFRCTAQFLLQHHACLCAALLPAVMTMD